MKLAIPPENGGGKGPTIRILALFSLIADRKGKKESETAQGRRFTNLLN